MEATTSLPIFFYRCYVRLLLPAASAAGAAGAAAAAAAAAATATAARPRKWSVNLALSETKTTDDLCGVVRRVRTHMDVLTHAVRT